MNMVVLSTSEAISDLLDQRSAIYSDRVRVSRPKHWTSIVNHLFTSHLPQWLSCESIRQTKPGRSDLLSFRNVGWEPLDSH
jgi:hypothetical protein